MAQKPAEIQSQSGDSVEFLEHIKVDLFPGRGVCVHPQGQDHVVAAGRDGSRFRLCAVHTDIGNRCIAAKINYELMPLRTVLRNGDRVEIITASTSKAEPELAEFSSLPARRVRISAISI